MTAPRKPSWLRAKLPSGPGYQPTRQLVDEHKLHTVCQSAQCPNLGECWSRGTATVMILGNICTRSCNFCASQTGRPTELDLGEPARVADAVAKMNLQALRHHQRRARRTHRRRRQRLGRDHPRRAPPQSAHRDRGARAGFQRPPRRTSTPCSTPSPTSSITTSRPWNACRSPCACRPATTARRSVLRHAKSRGFTTKTGIMLGLGEEQPRDRADDPRHRGRQDRHSDHRPISAAHAAASARSRAGCTPEEFVHWKEFGLELGLGVVESGALVRSSYHADEQSQKYTGVEHLNTANLLANA